MFAMIPPTLLAPPTLHQVPTQEPTRNKTCLLARVDYAVWYLGGGTIEAVPFRISVALVPSRGHNSNVPVK